MNPYQNPLPPLMPQQGMGAFVGSPGMVAAGSAINNMMQMRRGQAPTSNPMMDLAMERRRNQELQQRRMQVADQNRLNDLRAQQAQRNLNPFADYQQFQEMYPDQAEGMSFQDFSQLGYRGIDPGSVSKTFALWQQENPQQPNETAEQYSARRSEALNNIIRAPQTNMIGSSLISSGLNGVNTIVGQAEGDDLVRSSAGAEEAGARESASNANIYTDAVNSIDADVTALGLLNKLRDTSQQFLDALEGSDGQAPLDTGPISAFMMDVFGVGPDKLAQMNTETIDQMLDGLQIVNLAPVTVQELKLMSKRWADIYKQEKPNAAVLRYVLNKANNEIERVNKRMYRNSERVNTYGSAAQAEAFYRSTPQLRDIRNMYDDVDTSGMPD